MLNKIGLLVCSLAIALTLTACNTTRGAGEDIQAGGKAIERAAQ
ncbi:entericidin A/B family lipoprotein [Morganella morganii]|nr:entericidin A/B family lipoprotein [Morganella morganii]